MAADSSAPPSVNSVYEACRVRMDCEFGSLSPVSQDPADTYISCYPWLTHSYVTHRNLSLERDMVIRIRGCTTHAHGRVQEGVFTVATELDMRASQRHTQHDEAEKRCRRGGHVGLNVRQGPNRVESWNARRRARESLTASARTSMRMYTARIIACDNISRCEWYASSTLLSSRRPTLRLLAAIACR